MRPLKFLAAAGVVAGLIAAPVAGSWFSASPSKRERVKLALQARLGDVGAQVTLGERLAWKEHGEINPRAGLRWLERAAANGNAEAMAYIGELHSFGARGIPVDLPLAARWYRAAANRGHPLGQVNLASAYLEGRGVPKDVKAAMRWYREVADRPELADTYREAAATAIAEAATFGRGVPRDYALAMRYYLIAGRAGQSFGRYNHVRIGLSGRAGPVDRAALRRVAEEGAEAGVPLDQLQYGKMLWDGTGGPRDQVRGWSYMVRARRAKVHELVPDPADVPSYEALAREMSPEVRAEVKRRGDL